jgi:hypothetical protein
VRYNQYELMLVGRGLVGLGAGALTVAQQRIVSVWFGLSWSAFLLPQVVSRLGPVLTFFAAPHVASIHGLEATLWISAYLAHLCLRVHRSTNTPASRRCLLCCALATVQLSLSLSLALSLAHSRAGAVLCSIGVAAALILCLLDALGSSRRSLAVRAGRTGKGP